MENYGWIRASTSSGVPQGMSLLKGALAFLLVVFFVMTPAFSQENPAAKPEGAAVSAAAQEGADQLKDLTLYGEVQAVNPGSNSILVQYYNYDTDEEKAMEITFNKDTKIENAAALADIKKGDWVDVIYVTNGAKNVAVSLIVEKEEAITEESTEPPSSETLEPAVEE